VSGITELVHRASTVLIEKSHEVYLILASLCQFWTYLLMKKSYWPEPDFLPSKNSVENCFEAGSNLRSKTRWVATVTTQLKTRKIPQGGENIKWISDGNRHKVHRVPQCLSSRRNWDSPNPSLASECAHSPEPGGGALACGWEVGGVPISTTGKKLSTLPTLWELMSTVS